MRTQTCDQCRSGAGQSHFELCRQARAGAKTHGSPVTAVGATLAGGFSRKNREELQPPATGGIRLYVAHLPV
jgi:hypothetical protein